MSYTTGFTSTLLLPPPALPSFHPASSIPFSFTCPPNPSASSSTSSPASGSRHGSLHGRQRLPRGPPPPPARRARPSRPGASSATDRPEASSSRARPRHEHESGLERLLMGRAPLGVDLAAEKRDLSDEEQEEEYRDQAIRDFGHTFLLPIGVHKTQEELDAVQTRTPSPTPPHNSEDTRPSRHGGAHNHARQHHPQREPSPEMQDVDEMRDLDEDLEDEDAESGIEGDEEDEEEE